MRTLAALTLCGLAALARAFSQQGPPPAPKQPFFITAEQLPVLNILPAPPALDTPRGQAELAEVHTIQGARTPAQIAHAQADDAEEDIFIFKDILGEKFIAANLPATALLSAHMHSDEGIVVNPAKEFFAKHRPFQSDPTVKPVCKTKADPNDYGYPSGHSATGYLEALVLIQIVPEKRNEILSRADDYAHSRVVCGVHFTSDGQASKLVAYAMMGIIMNNPRFRKEFEAAKAETRQFLGM